MSGTCCRTHIWLVQHRKELTYRETIFSNPFFSWHFYSFDNNSKYRFYIRPTN